MFFKVMDLSLWEPSDGEDHHMFFESNYHVGDVANFGHNTVYSPVTVQSSYDFGDHWMREFSFVYGRDVIEEDSLNHKSCVQVLRILIDKADEEIMKLEEEIVMLQCRLTWDDEDWSKPCSAALREKIDHRDILIQSLKNEIKEDVHYLAVQIEQPEKLAPRLHDFVKPLLENYLLVKSKQTESSTIHMPAVLPADGLNEKKLESSTSEHKEKVEEKGCINLLKENERKNPFAKLEERKLNHPQQDIDKLNRLQGKNVPKSVPLKSRRRSSIKPEPPDPTVKALTANTSIEKAGSREMDERENTDKEVITKSKVTRLKLERESTAKKTHLEPRETERKIADTVKLADELLEMDCEKQTTQASIKIGKARTYSRAIDKNILLPTKPAVKIERNRTKFPEITEAVEEAQGMEMNDSLGLFLFNHRTKQASRLKMNLEHKTPPQQRDEIKSFKINQAKPISSSKPECQRPQKKCKAAPKTVQSINLAEEIDIESSSVENLTGQPNIGVLEKISKNGKNETQQVPSGIKIDGASKVDVTSISSPQKKKKSSFNSQIIREKKMKSEMDYNPSNSISQKAIYNSGLKKNSLLCIKDVERLTLNDLKIIARNQKLPGYYRLRKKELLERLGLEEPLYLQQKTYEKKGFLPANTI